MRKLFVLFFIGLVSLFIVTPAFAAQDLPPSSCSVDVQNGVASCYDRSKDIIWIGNLNNSEVHYTINHDWYQQAPYNSQIEDYIEQGVLEPNGYISRSAVTCGQLDIDFAETGGRGWTNTFHCEQEPPPPTCETALPACKPTIVPPHVDTLTIPGVWCEGKFDASDESHPWNGMPEGLDIIDGHQFESWMFQQPTMQYKVGPLTHGTWMQENEVIERVVFGKFKMKAWWTTVAGSPVYHCEPVGSAPAKKTQVVHYYPNCDPKIIVRRLNNNTNDQLDPADIIGISNPADPETRELWNISQDWGWSIEGEASLSWDSCWFAVERMIDGEMTLWWSDFSGVYPIKVDGKNLHGHHPEVGPNGEIVYDENGHLLMTDRYGSFVRNLNHGTRAEFNDDGSEIWLIDTNGNMRVIDTHGRYIRSTNTNVVDESVLIHSDPNEYRMFYRQDLLSQDLFAWTEQIIVDPILRRTTDLAVQPGSMFGYYIDRNNLFFTEEWSSTVGMKVTDPWDNNPNLDAIWSHPDWRN